MTRLFRVELKRALARRFVRVLIAIAVLAIGVTGVLVFMHTATFDAGTQTRARLQLEQDVRRCTFSEMSEATCRDEIVLDDYDKSLYVTDIWPSETDRDSVLVVAWAFLVFGGMLAAASVVGAEWRAGTVGTLLTWEPRRVRVSTTRIAVVTLAAAVIAFLLQLLFIGALLPSMLLHGGAGGVDGAWLLTATGAVAKGGAVTGFAALVGGSLAMIGRGTAVALGIAFVDLYFVESLVRTVRPGLGRFLIGDNAIVALAGKQSGITASPYPALTLLLYAAGLVALATALFVRRDVAGTS